ncbi:hypothetical protein ACET3Z_011792 [Daucus carota]
MAAADTSLSSSSSSSVSMTSPSWTQQEEAPPVISVVIGGESGNQDNSNAGGLKQVWGKPVNVNGSSGGAAVLSAAVATVDVSSRASEAPAAGVVMDTHSWPALSKAPPKSASSDSVPTSHSGSGMGSISSSKQVIGNTSSPNSNVNHVTNTRQRSIKRGTNNGGFIQPSSPQPQAPAVEVLPGKPGITTGESSSHKEGGPKGGFGNDHQPQRSNSFNRRGGGGQHLRGDASYHHSSGGRRDQDRGNQDWNHTQQSYGSRDNYMQQQRGAHRGYPRGPHASPFIAPQPLPVRPYPNHMVFPTDVPQPVFYVQSPESLRGVVPIMPQVAAHPMYYPPIPDPQLHVKIMNQIEYYFSNENLVKDTFLRRNMDEQGWVPIKLIAGFKKVMNLTDNILLILNAVQASTVVEVQNDRIRKRNEWMKWIMPPGPFSPVSSPQARAKSGHDMLTGQFQGVTLDERSVHGHTDMFKKSLSGEFSSQLQHSGGEGDVHSDFEHKSSAGSLSK